MEDLNINKVGDIDVLFSLVGWSIEGINPTPNNQKTNDDRWYTKPAPLFFPSGQYRCEDLNETLTIYINQNIGGLINKFGNLTISNGDLINKQWI